MNTPPRPGEPWVRPFLIALVPATLLAIVCTSRILARAGGPALPLDDAFIHLQYAARLAEGRWFEYTPGGGYSSGATSFAWPLAFVPFFWLGMKGLALVPVTWALGTLAHAGIVYEAWRFGRGLLGGPGGLAVASMCAAFGAFAWFACSGMETLAFAWILLRTARVVAEHAERRSLTSLGTQGQLAVLALAAPLVRPEGALASLLVLLAVGRDALRLGRRTPRRTAWVALAALVGPALVPLSHVIATGHAASSTAMVKHFAFDPYLDRAGFVVATLSHARAILVEHLMGGPYTAEFLPEGFALPVACGLVALPFIARRHRVGFRALVLVLLALGTLGPATYATLLWNRVRYLWPFAPAWFLLATTAFEELGYRLRRRVAMAGILAPALSFGLAAMLAMKLDWATADLATSARAIALQQVRLGGWAAKNLPPDALIGVNDTGAIAYLSGRRTFDVVGLTTEGEARYWAWGAGARFEHWERRKQLGVELPTHLFVYRQWMAMPAVEGDFLTAATVVDQSILGGRTMTAMTMDPSLLGSGEAPFSRTGGALVGRLDVADVESETERRFVLADARQQDSVVRHVVIDERREVADGGRLERVEDRFTLGTRRPLRLVMRVLADTPLEVWADGKLVGEAEIVATTASLDERALTLPAGADELVVRSVEPRRFASFHYWWFER